MFIRALSTASVFSESGLACEGQGEFLDFRVKASARCLVNSFEVCPNSFRDFLEPCSGQADAQFRAQLLPTLPHATPVESNPPIFLCSRASASTTKSSPMHRKAIRPPAPRLRQISFQSIPSHETSRMISSPDLGMKSCQGKRDTRPWPYLV